MIYIAEGDIVIKNLPPVSIGVCVKKKQRQDFSLHPKRTMNGFSEERGDGVFFL